MAVRKEGVGARHQAMHSPKGGGGYQDICSELELAVKKSRENFEKIFQPTLEDLREMGLSGKWLEVAEKIGVENWLEVWRILDNSNIDEPSHLRENLRVRIPLFSRFRRFYRNQVIYLLTEAGHDSHEIERFLNKINLEPISKPQIRMIRAEFRRKKKDE